MRRISAKLMTCIVISVKSVRRIIFWERMWSSVSLFPMDFQVVIFIKINISVRNALKIIIFQSQLTVSKLLINLLKIVFITKMQTLAKNVPLITSLIPVVMNVNYPVFLHVKCTVVWNLARNVMIILVS